MASIRQKLAFKKALENGGVISRAMAESNYSPSVAKNPKKLTESKGWKELTDKFLSDESLIKEHKKQLNSSKLTKIGFPLDVTREEIKEILTELDSKLLYLRKDNDQQMAFVKTPDRFFRDLAIDKGYKVKGMYAQPDGQMGGNQVLIINVPQEIIEKNALPMNSDTSSYTKHRSERPPQVQGS